MRRLLVAATAALGLLGATTGQVQAQSMHHGSSVHGSFQGSGFRGNGFRGNGFRGNGFRGGFGRGDAFAAGAIGFGLGAALASPYGYGYGPGYYSDYGPDYSGYDDPAYACEGWRWDPYRHRRIWMSDCD